MGELNMDKPKKSERFEVVTVDADGLHPEHVTYHRTLPAARAKVRSFRLNWPEIRTRIIPVGAR